MNIDEALIEQIVANVLGRLKHETPAVRAVAATAGAPTNSAPTTPAVPSSSVKGAAPVGVQILDAVITEESLRQQLNGQTRLTVGTHTVLTPSARDYLRTRQIDWSRQAVQSATTPTTGRFQALLVRSVPVVVNLLDDMQRSQNSHWSHELLGDAAEAADAAIGRICRADAKGIVVLAEETALVACRANRNAAIRAAAVDSVLSLQAAQQQIDVNVAVIDPTNKSYFELRNLLRVFSQTPA